MPSSLPYLLLLCCLAALIGGCERPTAAIPGADIERGRELLWQFGCGSCHEIEGVIGGVGKVGPPLRGMARRVYIGGVLSNTPEHLAQWIRTPQAFDPPTAMPNLGVTPEQARDMAAYLYTLE